MGACADRAACFSASRWGTFPLTVELGWHTGTLPNLIQWKMAGAGEHVLGIEPSNCFVEGRAAEREKGSLVRLAPREKVRTELYVEMQR
ncbi:DUF4432 family protein [Paenibacillus sp. CC-CFT747]|nr:DUF4432 family protein [Paenibacillus sp. CC-CFT747]